MYIILLLLHAQPLIDIEASSISRQVHHHHPLVVSLILDYQLWTTVARVQASLIALAIVTAAAGFTTAYGARYTVGQPRGSWDTETNLIAWASSINFKTGDVLVFNYSAAAHNVLEVTSSQYHSCSAENPMATYRTGNDAIQLGRALTRYFICGEPGHCAAGMKLEVRIAPAAAPTTCRRRRRQRRSNGIACLRKNSPPTFTTSPSSSSAASVSSGSVSFVHVIMVLLILASWCN